MKRTLYWIAVLGLITSLGILSCAKKEPEVIKIGAILAMTGDAATCGNCDSEVDRVFIIHNMACAT